MDFQRLLLDVGKALHKDEVKALAFLCTDLLGRNPSSVELASDLFSRLVDQDHLSLEKPHLLSELLCIIQRTRLLRDFNLPQPRGRSLISPYRKLLYNLSEEITEDDLKHMKFLLYTTVPRRRLEDNVTALEVFLVMEHMDLLSETNLSELETIIHSVCPMLQEKINQFKALRLLQPIPIPEEERTISWEGPAQPSSEVRIHSLGYVYNHETNHDISVLLIFTFSCVPYNLMGNPFNTTGQVLHRDQPLSPGRHGYIKVRSDAVESSLSQEIRPSFETPMVQTTNSGVLGVYPMTSAKRGICIIINNYDFTSSKLYLTNREGTMTDKDCLHDVFKWLGFEIEIHPDCKSDEMQSVLEELSRRDHCQMDCLVCCILSHGLEGSVYGVDGKPVEIKKLTELFDGLKCPSLAKKPKLFFIQACQGTQKQRAVYIEGDGPTSSLCSDAVVVKDSIPAGADFLQAMSTVPSFISYRERKNGTWFIQSLCENLIQMVPSGCDLVSILTKVNADVSQKTDDTGTKKQMPQPAFSLRKKVVFPIPRQPPPSLPSVCSLQTLVDQ
ncbi:caspase-8 isoform X1 [Mastacembelus armatus]|uniref:caspase-8 isoform X1 n=1 Tax=Mastacembelus armatus TaxID=205130 RepID=UPI000E455F24|nr:caspase-10 isoform X1 [Mastacembelus armatus]